MKRGLFYLFLLFIFLGVIAILLWHFNFLKLQERPMLRLMRLAAVMVLAVNVK